MMPPTEATQLVRSRKFRNVVVPHVGRGLVLFEETNSPIVIDSVVASDGEKAAVQKEWIIIEVTMPERELGVSGRLEIDCGVYLGEPFVQ
jgi:hypothetical protein